VEILLYLAHKGGGFDHYQVVKLLYLADKEHFSRHGRPITNEKYAALPYGPVASHTLDLLRKHHSKAQLEKFGIKKLPFTLETVGDHICLGRPLRAVNYDLFSKSDLKVVDEVVEKYGHYSFKQLYDLTHAHFAYSNAWNGRKKGSKSAPISYADMLEESHFKRDYISEIAPIVEYM
jgi:uncharacterized phage-associated protein